MKLKMPENTNGYKYSMTPFMKTDFSLAQCSLYLSWGFCVSAQTQWDVWFPRIQGIRGSIESPCWTVLEDKARHISSAMWEVPGMVVCFESGICLMKPSPQMGECVLWKEQGCVCPSTLALPTSGTKGRWLWSLMYLSSSRSWTKPWTSLMSLPVCLLRGKDWVIHEWHVVCTTQYWLAPWLLDEWMC